MQYVKSGLPGEIPPEAEALANYVEKEFDKVAQAIQEQDLLQLQELHAAPTKLKTGLIALADGTDWNPGSGAGFYGYYAGSWSKLG